MLRNFTPSSSLNRFIRSMSTSIPKATPLFEKAPGNKIDLAKELHGSNAIILGVPGAYSGACSDSYIPGYIKNYSKFVSKGYSKIVVISVNDVFVMNAWKNTFKGLNSNIEFFADPSGEFTKELGYLFDASPFFGNQRSKRYALVVDSDGEIVKSFVEPDSTPVTISNADNVLSELEGLE